MKRKHRFSLVLVATTSATCLIYVTIFTGVSYGTDSKVTFMTDHSTEQQRRENMPHITGLFKKYIQKLKSNAFSPLEVMSPSRIADPSGISISTSLPPVCKFHRTFNHVQCQRYLAGDMLYINSTIPSLDTAYLAIEDGKQKLLHSLRNCSYFRIEYGYSCKTYNITIEEENFPLAFAIKMHINTEQVERLLWAIYRPHNVYCIHVDAKSDNSTFNSIKEISSCLSNVIVLDKRIRLSYATFDHIEAELACMRVLIDHEVEWKYYINLAGQEMPLKTNLEIIRILKIFNGTNDVESYPIANYLTSKGQLDDRFVDRYTNKTFYQMFPYNITVAKGSAYGMLTRDFVKFILQDSIPRLFTKSLRNLSRPEETFLATLNTIPFGPGSYPPITSHEDGTFVSRAMVWSWDEEKVQCGGGFVRAVCIFNSHNLNWLLAQKSVIANKFYYKEDPLAVDCLAEYLHNKTMIGKDHIDRNYYHTLPHVLYRRRVEATHQGMQHIAKIRQRWLREHQIEIR